jgi:type IV secretory pathway TrbF-like protein
MKKWQPHLKARQFTMTSWSRITTKGSAGYWCGSGVIIVALTTALGIITLRPHNIPYVVEVDSKGEPTGVIQPFELHTAITDNTIRWAISESREYVFCVTRSFGMNQLRLSQVYAESTSQASDALTSYYRANQGANNPLVINNKYWQDVKVIRTLQLPANDTYQVDYVVTKHDHDHPFNGVATNWRATMRVLEGKPTTNNALGLWVTDLDCSPEAQCDTTD